MKTSVSIALFALLIVIAIVAVEKYKLSDSIPLPVVSETAKVPHIWNCVYQDKKDKKETFTMQEFSEHILIDGKYKVFHRGTEETPPFGDFVSTYTNKGYTYDIMYDDGRCYMGVKRNYSERRIAWCD